MGAKVFTSGERAKASRLRRRQSEGGKLTKEQEKFVSHYTANARQQRPHFVVAPPAPVAPPKKRGRPPKLQAAPAPVAPPKKRGRPPKASAADREPWVPILFPNENDENDAHDDDDDDDDENEPGEQKLEASSSIPKTPEKVEVAPASSEPQPTPALSSPEPPASSGTCDIPDCTACKRAGAARICGTTGERVWPPMGDAGAKGLASGFLGLLMMGARALRADHHVVEPSEYHIEEMAKALREVALRRASWIGAIDDLLAVMYVTVGYTRLALTEPAPAPKQLPAPATQQQPLGEVRKIHAVPGT